VLGVDRTASCESSHSRADQRISRDTADLAEPTPGAEPDAVDLPGDSASSPGRSRAPACITFRRSNPSSCSSRAPCSSVSCSSCHWQFTNCGCLWPRDSRCASAASSARSRVVAHPFSRRVGFAYFIASFALRALLSLADTITDLEPNIVASEYLSFIMTLMILFGVIFEFPLVLVLSTHGLVSAAMLPRSAAMHPHHRGVRRALHATRPVQHGGGHPPLLLLYEVSIWIIRVLERRDASTLPASGKIPFDRAGVLKAFKVPVSAVTPSPSEQARRILVCRTTPRCAMCLPTFCRATSPSRWRRPLHRPPGATRQTGFL